MLTDPHAWNLLANHSKDAFLRHATAGVVWDRVLREITRAQVGYICRDAKDIVPRQNLLPGMPTDWMLLTHEAPDPLRDAIDAALNLASVKPPPRPPPPKAEFIDATVIIDARGFDRLAFIGGMGLASGWAATLRAAGVQNLEAQLDHSLAPNLPGCPRRLHLPGLGGRQGPAAGNLIALGWLANRVLGAC